MKTDNQTTPEEMRIEVCEWIGWKQVVWEEQSFSHPGKTIKSKRWAIDRGAPQRTLPPLTLDWLHECEKKVIESNDLGYKYDMTLVEITGAYGDKPRFCNHLKLWHATAEQRLEALYRTIKNV